MAEIEINGLIAYGFLFVLTLPAIFGVFSLTKGNIDLFAMGVIISIYLFAVFSPSFDEPTQPVDTDTEHDSNE